jgi:hypothetical protein
MTTGFVRRPYEDKLARAKPWGGYLTRVATTSFAQRISTPSVETGFVVSVVNVTGTTESYTGNWMKWGLSGPDGNQVFKYQSSPLTDTAYNFLAGGINMWPNEYMYVDVSGVTSGGTINLWYRGTRYEV